MAARPPMLDLTPPEELVESARRSFAARAWRDAAAAFAAADAKVPLKADDRERWAAAAGLSGDDAEMIAPYERLYRELHGVDDERAAQAAFWAAHRLFALGETARASGWLSRAERLVGALGDEVALVGYLELPLVARKLREHAFEEAFAAAERAAKCGERHRNLDLIALGLQLQGRIRLRQERFAEGLALLDEAMLSATGGELSPVATGVVYCGAIAGCRAVYALDRAREWTRALSEWCQTQPQLAPFRGACAVFRAELLELGGAWEDAIAELSATSSYQLRAEAASVAEARYREGEIHRLRGDLARAETAYRAASELGADPQPGYALLCASRGQVDSGLASLRRALAAHTEPLARARLLPSMVVLALEAGSQVEARTASAELRDVAARCASAVLLALSDEAEALIALADDAPADALPKLRAALETWQRLEAPYYAAKARESLARSYRALGDAAGALLEQEAARASFARLGIATRDASAVPTSYGLSERELQVLRLVARGDSNKEIASALGLSVKTVDRHLSNLFDKLGVGSRAAATAFAFQHGLMGSSTH